MNSKIPITDFDLNTTSWMLQTAKAALPFFNNSLQRQLSLIIRCLELSSTINYYNSLRGARLCGKMACGGMGCGNVLNSLDMASLMSLAGRPEFLQCIEPYCPSTLFSVIKNYKMFAGMQQNMQQDMFSSYMTDEQKKMYEEYSKRFENIF